MSDRQTELLEFDSSQNGAVILTNTTAITGSFRKIYTITETVFSVLTIAGHTTNGGSTQSVGADYGTYPADRWIFGDISAITLTSGSVIVYK